MTKRQIIVLAASFISLTIMMGLAPEKSRAVTPIAPGILPFTQLPLSTLKASAKKVFAHYVPVFPLSLDNLPSASDYYQSAYLNPSGEAGKHAYCGGYLFERPLPQAVQTQSNWDLANMETEVQRASACGLDGFTVDIMATSGVEWSRVLDLFNAAAVVDPTFKCVIMPDMAAEFSTEPNNVVPAIEALAKSPAAYRLADGRLVVAPFDAQLQSPTWWKNILAELKTAGVNVAFVPLFQGWRTYSTAYASISYGFADWADDNPVGSAMFNGASPASAVHKYVTTWMAPVSPQDFRPKDLDYQEAENTTNYRINWQGAIANNADWVQVVTWNDYSESTEISPSSKTQYSFYDLTAYYIQWFKTGVQPAITHDVVYYLHRAQPSSVIPNPAVQPDQYVNYGSTATSNNLEILSFMTKPSTIKIVDGASVTTQNVPAGMTSTMVALQPGQISFQVIRSGATVTSGVSPWAVGLTAPYQNFLYEGGSSSR
jgi:hypothetical protein